MENTIPYQHQAHLHAMNDCLLELQKEGETNPELFNIQRVTDSLIMRWRSIGVGNEVDQLSAETDAKNAERAMVAAARQILDDKAKEPVRQH